MAPAVRKLLMMGLDSILLRKPSLALLKKTNSKPDTKDICRDEIYLGQSWTSGKACHVSSFTKVIRSSQ